MDFRVPELGEGVYEAELVRWLVQPGAAVQRGQTLMEVLTDKATMEVPSPFAGAIEKLALEEGQQIKVGDVALTYTSAGEGAQTPVREIETPKKASVAKAARAKQASTNGPASRLPVKAAPSVRLMARKLGVDINQVPGSGPDGRVLIEDLSQQIQRASPAEKKAAEPKPDYGKPGTRVKLVGLRRKIAEHMVHSKQTIPHYTYVDECDMTNLVRLRQGLRETAASKGIKLTYLPFVVKAVVAALKEVPIVNASLDEQAGEIVLHDHYHIGVATATPQGLIVPVVRDADKKDLLALAGEIERLSEDARTGKSKREDLTGGTFTITSIGSLGGLFATPIIHHPQVGILGLGKIVKRPVFDDRGAIKAADLMYLSLSFDHRVLDGAVGVAFGNAILKQLQNPAAMLVG